MTQVKEEFSQWLESATQKRKQLSADPHRPQYHFLPPNNWMNDPNGLIYWQGKYHMFYQHNPNNPFWGDIHWGHTVSDDLVHWKDLPYALTPDMPPVDSSGCWSGCAVNDNGIPTILYTGVKNGEQTTCMATSDDNLITWQKDYANPIERAPQQPGFHYKDYRDPFVWREGDTWYQVISMTINNQGNVLLYRSSDLHNWEYLHPLISGDVRQPIHDEADIWECPNFFPLGDKWVLMISVWKNHTLLYPAAYIGEYKDLHFYPETFQRLDYGLQCMYAPLTFETNSRRLFFGWMQEQRSRDEQIKAGWSGVMSLPRVLTLENNRIQSLPASETQSLRKDSYTLESQSLESEITFPLQGKALEVILTVKLAKNADFFLKLGTSQEQTLISYNQAKAELSVDIRSASPTINDDKKIFTAPHELKNYTLTLHLFVDHSTIELFADYTTCTTARIYPNSLDDPMLSLSNQNGQVHIEKLEIWNMKPIWNV